MNKNYTCICGHTYDQHREVYSWNLKPACMISSESELFHECVFKADNLKWLESLSES